MPTSMPTETEAVATASTAEPHIGADPPSGSQGVLMFLAHGSFLPEGCVHVQASPALRGTKASSSQPADSAPSMPRSPGEAWPGQKNPWHRNQCTMQRWSVGEARGQVVWIQVPAPPLTAAPWPRAWTLHTSVPSLSVAITSYLPLGLSW